MKDRRSSRERIRLVLLVVLAVGLALGSFWVLEIMHKSLNESLPNAPRTEPDYYIEQFKFVRMTNTGQVHYALSGSRLTHNPQDGSYEIQQPIIKSLTENQAPLTVRAERAISNQDNSKIDLYGNVLVDRPPSSTAELFHVKSDYMLALPDQDILQTDKPVEIALGTSILTGTGMYANNATRVFRLASNVHGVYQPAGSH